MTSLDLTDAQRAKIRAENLSSYYTTAPERLEDGSEIYTADHRGAYYLAVFAGGDALCPKSICLPWIDMRDEEIEAFKLARLGKDASKRG